MALTQCPHCSKPVVVPDATDIGPLQAQISRLETKVDGITQTTSGHPRPSADLINLWSTCPDCAPMWRQVRAELSKQAVKSVHVKPSTGLIQEFENCPECKEAWEKMKRDNPELFKPREPAQAGTKWWWEKKKEGE